MMAQRSTHVEAASPRVLHYFAFPGGGIGRYLNELLTAMHQLDALRFELACIPSFEYRSTAKYPVWPGLFEITHSVSLLRRMKFAINLVINPLRAIRRAKHIRANIIHLSSIPHVTFALWSRTLRRSGLRLVATAHDVRRHHALVNLRYEILQLQRLYRACEVLFVHSEYQKRDLIDFAGVDAERVWIVPHGPYDYGPPSASKEELRRRYGIPLDKQVALFFGDIRRDKNLDILIRAVAPYRERVFLLVAGRIKGAGARPLGYYQQLAAECGIAESIRFDVRYIPDEEVADLFTAADWVALPYSRTFTSQSGVLNIAAAYRRPIVASGCGTFLETVARYRLGVIVPPDDPEALARGIHRLISEASAHYEFDRYTAETAWPVNAARTIEAYTAVVHEYIKRQLVVV